MKEKHLEHEQQKQQIILKSLTKKQLIQEQINSDQQNFNDSAKNKDLQTKLKYKNVIENIISTLYNNEKEANVNSIFVENMLKNNNIKDLDQKLNEKYSEKVKQSKNWQFQSKQDYLNSKNSYLLKDEKIQELNQIDQYYEKLLKETKFNNFEQEDNQKKIQDKLQFLSKPQFPKIKVKSKIWKIAEEIGLFEKKVDRTLISGRITTIKGEIKQTSQNIYDENAMKLLNEYVVKIEEKSCNDCQKTNIQLNDHNKLKLLQKISIMLTKLMGKFSSKINKAIDKSNIRNNQNSKKQTKLNQIEEESIIDLSQSQPAQNENLSDNNSPMEKSQNFNHFIKAISKQDNQNSPISLQKNKVEETNINLNKPIDQINYIQKLQNENKSQSLENNQSEEKNFIQKNISAARKKHDLVNSIRQESKDINSINFPQLMLDIPNILQNESKKIQDFTRAELIEIYNKYYILNQVSSQRYQNYDPKKGVDYYTFRNGIEQVFLQSEELAQRIFNKIDENYSGFMDWTEFLQLMISIRAKTLGDKLNLFIKMADEDGNGKLSWDEIYNLTKICLQRYITCSGPDDTILPDLCHYFTRLIYQTVKIKEQDEIPLKLIKKTIKNGHPNAKILCLFCGADA